MMTHGKAKHLKDTRNSTQRSASLIWTKRQHEEKSQMTARSVKDSLCAFFFSFLFFSLSSVLLSKDIGYVIQIVSMLQSLRTQQKTPFRKTRRNQSNALTWRRARRSGCSETTANGLHTNWQITASVPFNSVVVVCVERLQKTSTNNVRERVSIQSQCGLVLASNKGHNQKNKE